MIAGLIQLMRPAHWVKNVFVLAPLVFAGRLGDTELVTRALAALLCFSLAASAVYAFNDLRDRHEDRNHPLKRHRPVASGQVSPGAATTASVLLAISAVALGWWLGKAFLVLLIAYLALNLAYTLTLKQIVILDVMTIAAGFVLRVAGGGAAIAVEVSAWLLLCTIFLALFLAFSKRRHELVLLSHEAADQRRVLEHYSPTFLDQMINVVTASTVVSYALYSVSPSIVERFGYRFLVLTIPFVLFGVFRYLYLIYHRENRLNPTEAVVRDVPSIANIALWGLAVCAILYLG